MDALQLWAMVSFTARGGNTEGLLNAAASGGLHLSRLTVRPDGFAGQCAAWRYRRLASMARRRRVRLRIQKRMGLFFCLRPLFRRTGLWVGAALFVPLLLWSRSLVWAVDYGALPVWNPAHMSRRSGWPPVNTPCCKAGNSHGPALISSGAGCRWRSLLPNRSPPSFRASGRRCVPGPAAR